MYVRAYIIWWLCTLCSLSNVAVWFEKSQLLMFFYNINVFLDGFCKDKQLFRIIALFARFFARFFYFYFRLSPGTMPYSSLKHLVK